MKNKSHKKLPDKKQSGKKSFNDSNSNIERLICQKKIETEALNKILEDLIKKNNEHSSKNETEK